MLVGFVVTNVAKQDEVAVPVFYFITSLRFQDNKHLTR